MALWEPTEPIHSATEHRAQFLCARVLRGESNVQLAARLAAVTPNLDIAFQFLLAISSLVGISIMPGQQSVEVKPDPVFRTPGARIDLHHWDRLNAARLIAAGAIGDSDMASALALAVCRSSEGGQAEAGLARARHVILAMLETFRTENTHPSPNGPSS